MHPVLMYLKLDTSSATLHAIICTKYYYTCSYVGLVLLHVKLDASSSNVPEIRCTQYLSTCNYMHPLSFIHSFISHSIDLIQMWN